jgi:pimeloyl-ACP methyl ester carboxylesterase
VNLALYRVRPDRAGRPAALLVHGAFTSHRVWVRGPGGGFAAYLAERGFDVWLADLRHHGASDREPRKRVWRFDDLILGDAPALVARVCEEVRGPIVWIGHSIGGVVGLCWLARAAPPGAIGAVVTLGTPGPGGRGPAVRALVAATAGLCRVLGHFPARALRMGPEDECGHVFGDWMWWNATRRWLGRRDGFDYLGALARVRTPYLGVAGDADHLWAPPHDCGELVERVGSPRKALVVCGPRLGHAGLLLSSRAPAECWPRVAAWLEEECDGR